MYNPASPLHRGVTRVQGGNVTPLRHTPLHVLTSSQSFNVRLIFHIYACYYFELTPPAVLWLPRRAVTARVAWFAHECQTWQLIPHNFSSASEIWAMRGREEMFLILAFLGIFDFSHTINSLYEAA